MKKSGGLDMAGERPSTDMAAGRRRQGHRGVTRHRATPAQSHELLIVSGGTELHRRACSLPQQVLGCEGEWEQEAVGHVGPEWI